MLIFSSCSLLNSPCLTKPSDSKRSYGQARKCLSTSYPCMSKISALWKPVLYCHFFIIEVCKPNQNVSTKIKLFKECLCCECTWGLGLLQKESTYCTILFPFLLLGFGLLQWETKLALVFKIQTFHSFFFPPLLSFPDFTSPPDIWDTILQLQLGLRVVSHYQLPKNWAHCLMTKQLHLSNLQRTPMFSPKKMHTFRFWKY